MEIDKDTVLCMSLAGRPGGFGTRFHNFLYRELGLNFVYKAFTTSDLAGAIGGVRALGVRGCAVSMPFKEAVIGLLDEMDGSAGAIESVNTVVNTGGRLRGYNTDYVAIRKLIARHGLRAEQSVVVRGSGGMAKAVASAFRDAGFGRGVVVARNEVTGRRLAERCGWEWRGTVEGARGEVLVNVTPVGMAGGVEAEELAFDVESIEGAAVVFDVVARPVETPLIRAARRASRGAGKQVITGGEVIVLQAVEQFELYTGVRPGDESVERARAWAMGVG